MKETELIPRNKPIPYRTGHPISAFGVCRVFRSLQDFMHWPDVLTVQREPHYPGNAACFFLKPHHVLFLVFPPVT